MFDSSVPIRSSLNYSMFKVCCRDVSFLCVRACSWLLACSLARSMAVCGCVASYTHSAYIRRSDACTPLLLRRIFVVSTSTPRLLSRDYSAQAFPVLSVSLPVELNARVNRKGLEPRLYALHVIPQSVHEYTVCLGSGDRECASFSMCNSRCAKKGWRVKASI